ncbi:hypothetical protein [Paraburkholderia sp. C35]|uniref:hypothetical protein n=1 Tax=Paraburkholderia sp. C35 TaxID=2126993 RepID=UPI000D68B695|nr:hypothetical protein [Paraburkholderia sp. C35]
MKVFLLSDLVGHELVSMELEGEWLTTEQFSESACLWASRHGHKNKLSRQFISVLQREALEIAERLARDGAVTELHSPLTRVLLDICAVNYADPLSARALAASLEVCRTKLCDFCCADAGSCGENSQRETRAWPCHPALRQLLCGHHVALCKTMHDVGND